MTGAGFGVDAWPECFLCGFRFEGVWRDRETGDLWCQTCASLVLQLVPGVRTRRVVRKLV